MILSFLRSLTNWFVKSQSACWDSFDRSFCNGLLLLSGKFLVLSLVLFAMFYKNPGSHTTMDKPIIRYESMLVHGTMAKLMQH